MVVGYAVLSTIGISLLSLVGVVTLTIHHRFLQKIIHLLVALSAGTMMGAVFLHLLPEAHAELAVQPLYNTVLTSFIFFFLIEKVLHWQHCHDEGCEVHSFGYMNLIGDGLHNFIDGLVIVGAYQTSVQLGIITTLAVALHELPQELGDFGVLLHAGFSAKKAIIFNLLSSLTALLGAVVGWWLIGTTAVFSAYLLPVAAGGFLYIAASDLLPELRQETVGRKVIFSFSVFLLGIVLMASAI